MDGRGKPTEDHRLELNLEKRGHRRRQVALYRSIISHIVGIITAVAELHIGEKVSLREEKKR